ncbi:Syntaxin-1A protein [Fasciolopsis buskii]|uniref:Syntaxin-1A protein n=1 Tax=Fasciolopsis buskii TaxID=27845 RepID=A0A8E0RS05_9TREM|nr:Syntaxin-1A protein [Fasciolopsis buski]
MVKDRLAELRSVCVCLCVRFLLQKGNVRSNNKAKLDKADGLLDSGFLDEVSQLLQIIAELRDHVAEVEAVQRNILASPQQDAQLDDRLIQLTRTIRQEAYDVRTALKAGYSFSEQELEDMLEKKNPEIFTQAIMADTEAAKRSLSDIEARHADIVRLEKSIEELRDLFMAVSLMVDQQSELIDRVEYNVNKAVDCVVQAKGKLSSAVVQNKKGRRRKIICIVILIVLAILAIIAIASAIGLT